jgi:acetate kinase
MSANANRHWPPGLSPTQSEAVPTWRAAYSDRTSAQPNNLAPGAAVLGGLDAFVFTAGIGENSDGIRARISEKLAWLGAELDVKANAGRKPLISRPDSRVKLYVIPTDEELMIAEHTIATIAQSKTSDLIALR